MSAVAICRRTMHHAPALLAPSRAKPLVQIATVFARVTLAAHDERLANVRQSRIDHPYSMPPQNATKLSLIYGFRSWFHPKPAAKFEAYGWYSPQ